MSENYDLISENDMHMPIRCIMQRFDHIRSQMHDYFELSMIVSGNCTLQLDDHIYNLTEDDVFCVNPLSLHELHARRCIVKQVAHEHGRAVRAARLAALRHNARLEMQTRAEGRVRPLRQHVDARDEGNGRQRIAAEAERVDGL